jgi:hypothetical protein
MRGSSSLAEIAATAHERIHTSICDLGDLQAELRSLVSEVRHSGSLWFIPDSGGCTIKNVCMLESM